MRSLTTPVQHLDFYEIKRSLFIDIKKFIFCVCNQDMKKNKQKNNKNVDVKKIGNVFISFRAELKLNICFVFTPDRIILLVTRKGVQY